MKKEEKVFQIRKFLGLNECPDGDTQLKLGEAGDMRNWQVTPQFHLKVRPGFRTLERFRNPVRGMWSGFVAGKLRTVIVADGGVWVLEDDAMRRVGDIYDGPATMFGFGGKVYFLNGREYLVWDGEGFVDTVEGYVPLVVTAMSPAGGGTAVENINRLTGKRRCRFSADGEAKEFHLPEENLLSVDRVVVGLEEHGAWRADLRTGVVTFDAAPEAGDSNVEIWYTMPNTLRALVEGMRFAEQFNGAADTRVFLYGDGSAKAIYCGVTEEGVASAEYFPDLFEIVAGGENAPLTGMIKYYDRLMSYKADGGAYSTRYETTELEDGSVIPGFLTVSINREIGNAAMGQVRLVRNLPRTIYGGNVYDWVMANYATRDERNAKIISQRVQETARRIDPETVFCFDDDTRQEYYIFLNDGAGTALVHNYQIDVWYLYTGLPAVCGCRVDGAVLLGFSDGRVVRFGGESFHDDGEAIDAYFAGGHMDFGVPHRKKHAAVLWVAVKPTANAQLRVSVRSDRGSYGEQEVSMELATFRNMDLGRWSFLTVRSPQNQRLRIGVRRFAYLQLILRSCYRVSDATVLAVDCRVRGCGDVK